VKKRACTNKATETPIVAAQGPSTTAINVPPTAWALVPPGTGALNIMIVKEKAARMDRRGTVLLVRASLIFFAALYQKGATAAYITPQVAGLRYPSGICILFPPCR